MNSFAKTGSRLVLPFFVVLPGVACVGTPVESEASTESALPGSPEDVAEAAEADGTSSSSSVPPGCVQVPAAATSGPGWPYGYGYGGGWGAPAGYGYYGGWGAPTGYGYGAYGPYGYGYGTHGGFGLGYGSPVGYGGAWGSGYGGYGYPGYGYYGGLPPTTPGTPGVTVYVCNPGSGGGGSGP